MKSELEARVARDQAIDEELRRHPPGVTVERRLERVERFAYDKECLRLVVERLAQ
jgi:hypothetical protein